VAANPGESVKTTRLRLSIGAGVEALAEVRLSLPGLYLLRGVAGVLTGFVGVFLPHPLGLSEAIETSAERERVRLQ